MNWLLDKSSTSRLVNVPKISRIVPDNRLDCTEKLTVPSMRTQYWGTLETDQEVKFS